MRVRAVCPAATAADRLPLRVSRDAIVIPIPASWLSRVQVMARDPCAPACRLLLAVPARMRSTDACPPASPQPAAAVKRRLPSEPGFQASPDIQFLIANVQLLPGPTAVSERWADRVARPGTLSRTVLLWRRELTFCAVCGARPGPQKSPNEFSFLQRPANGPPGTGVVKSLN